MYTCLIMHNYKSINKHSYVYGDHKKLRFLGKKQTSEHPTDHPCCG